MATPSTAGLLADATGVVLVGQLNLGEPHDYRVPDRGLHLPGPDKL